MFREEREKRETPIRETWVEIQCRAQHEPRWARKALERANKECSKLLEPEPPPLINLGLREPVEWKIFYTFLLEWFVRTDGEVKEWEYTASIIYPVREELLEELVEELNFISVKKAKDWFEKVDSASHWIVIEWKKDVSNRERYYQVGRLADRFGNELEEIYEAPD